MNTLKISVSRRILVFRDRLSRWLRNSPSDGFHQSPQNEVLAKQPNGQVSGSAVSIELIQTPAKSRRRRTDPGLSQDSETQQILIQTFEEMLLQLEREIGYRFKNRKLLRRALTHRSFANEQPDPRPMHNEALEFLGDAVLEFLISSWLLELHPTHNEGTLSKMRAYAVSAVNLQKHAAKLKLGSYLLLNRGEEKTGGRSKTALQVDAYEALIAAIYLDGGIESAKDFIRREFASTFIEIDPQDLTATDYKTALQERLQSHGLPTPQYSTVETLGPDHRRIFQVELRANGFCLATGEGTTIKSAHQSAARTAIDNLEASLTQLKAAQTPSEPRSAEPAEPALPETASETLIDAAPGEGSA